MIKQKQKDKENAWIQQVENQQEEQIRYNRYYMIVMKPNNKCEKRQGKGDLRNTLKQLQLNCSWKASSFRPKTKTGLVHEQNKNNLMTEQDVDRLFQKSNEKMKLKTQISPSRQYQLPNSPKVARDFTCTTKFLHIEDEYDKFLTGFTASGKENNHRGWDECSDLTTKFKQNYLVGKIVGQGAYALVRVAVVKADNKKVAIKAYEKIKVKQTARKKALRRQIKILQNLNHQNIVKIIDVVQTNNHLNIVMEYLSGISLATSLRQQPGSKFSQINAKNIVKQLANALSYLHSKNIAHRDIKLQNVILDQKLSPKLIDFGFSTCMEPTSKVKIFCGTPSYMAPEIVQRQEYRGQTADVWALGVLIYVMIVGQFPFRGATDDELYFTINRGQYPKSELISRPIANLLDKIFVVDPINRIKASSVLSHPWISGQKEIPPFHSTKLRIEPTDMKRILSGSKQRNTSARQELSSKKAPVKKPSKGKDLSSTLSNIMNQTANLQKNLRHHLQQKSHSGKKLKPQNKLKIVDILKLQLRKHSRDKAKCKSHRF